MFNNQNKALQGLNFFHMMNISKSLRNFAYGLAIALCGAVAMQSCKTLQYVPVETDTQVHIIDSTAIHYLDSIRIYEATRYRDFAWMGDTLKLNGNRSRAWAVADTLKGAIVGEIEEDPVEEKTRIIYKDRVQYKDSIRSVEVPVPVEVTKEIKVIPKFWRVMGILGIILSCVLVGLGIFKLKKVFKIF